MGVAMAAAGCGHPRTALQLFGATDRYSEDLGRPWGPTSFWRRWADRYRDVARTALGDEADQVVHDGRALTPAAAVALAHTVVSSPADRSVERPFQ